MTARDDHARGDVIEARPLLSSLEDTDGASPGQDGSTGHASSTLSPDDDKSPGAARPLSSPVNSASVTIVSENAGRTPISSSPAASFGMTDFTKAKGDDARDDDHKAPTAVATELPEHGNDYTGGSPLAHSEHNMESMNSSLSLEAGRHNSHHDDYDDEEQGQHENAGLSAPLLTNIEAPSVTVATTQISPEDHLEHSRPRSGLRSAFMNMANSIIGAGIIGQPYAFRQAGLLMGILLLVGLTVAVDWTIRLIVVNSKLSGADSFQATVEFCFGRPGLIAISLAQWAFAYGGMIAFCIIVGDTIPHVLAALFPGLDDMPVLWLLTNRRAIIVLFVLGVSFPLSLYRDISKVSPFFCRFVP